MFFFFDCSILENCRFEILICSLAEATVSISPHLNNKMICGSFISVLFLRFFMVLDKKGQLVASFF